jgi:hypothetical protein
MADAERRGAADAEGVSDAVRAQILATEHWSLLSTRSMTWSEMFSRASMFFTVVSAAIVALALVAQSTELDGNFRLFAIPLLTAVLVVGLGTFMQLVHAEAADLWLVAGMNRLRHAYLDLAPELEPYFVAGHHDDRGGVQLTGWAGISSGPMHLFASTPAIVSAVNAVVAGTLVGLLAAAVGAMEAPAAAAGIVAGVAIVGGSAIAMRRARARFWHDYRPRFPC